MLEVKDLTLCYSHSGPPVIDGLSFTVQPGKILAIAGPSGCGKTTLVNALSGSLSPVSGSIAYGGRPLTPQNCSIGLLPQSYGLLPWKTVRGNCLFCSEIKENGHILPWERNHPNRGTETAGASRPALADHLDSLAGELGIQPLLERYPGTLSGGQAQRVALARAFLMDPQLLLMDEPFGALDIAAAAAARRLCLKLCRESRCCAVIITHRLEDAFYLADQIAVMPKGRAGHFQYLYNNEWQGKELVDSPAYAKAFAALSAEILAAAKAG